MNGAEIAFCLAMALSTVSAGNERHHPGELIHVDIKKLGVITGVGYRITGRRDSRQPQAGRRGEPKRLEFVHVCVDATRLAYVEALGDERAPTAAGFLRRAVSVYARHGIDRWSA